MLSKSAIVLARLVAVTAAIGCTRYASAQGPGRATILVYPDATVRTTGQAVEFTTAGDSLALDRALAAAPAGSFIYIPPGYAESTLTATHVVSKSNITITCAPGVSITRAAPVTMLRITGNNVTINGSCRFNGNNSAHRQWPTQINVVVFGASNVTIDNITLADAANDYGVEAVNAPGFRLNNPNITSGYAGVDLIVNAPAGGDGASINGGVITKTPGPQDSGASPIGIVTNRGGGTLNNVTVTNTLIYNGGLAACVTAGGFGGPTVQRLSIINTKCTNTSGGYQFGHISAVNASNYLVMGNTYDFAGQVATGAVFPFEAGTGDNQIFIGNSVVNVSNTGNGIVKDGPGRGFQAIGNNIEGDVIVYANPSSVITAPQIIGNTLHETGSNNASCVVLESNGGPGSSIINALIDANQCTGTGNGSAIALYAYGTPHGAVDSTMISNNQLTNFRYILSDDNGQTNTVMSNNWLPGAAAECADVSSCTGVTQKSNIGFPWLIPSAISSTVFVSAPSFNTGSSSNTDSAGFLTLDNSGMAVWKWAGLHPNGAICNASDRNGFNVIGALGSAASLTLTASGGAAAAGHTAQWQCTFPQ